MADDIDIRRKEMPAEDDAEFLLETKDELIAKLLDYEFESVPIAAEEEKKEIISADATNMKTRERVAKLLKNKKLRDALADNNVVRSSISNYANKKKTPGIGALALISQLSNVSMEYLCGLSDEPLPDAESEEISRRYGISRAALEEMKSISDMKPIWNSKYRRFAMTHVRWLFPFKSYINDCNYYSENPDRFKEQEGWRYYDGPNLRMESLINSLLESEKLAPLTEKLFNDLMNCLAAMDMQEYIGTVREYEDKYFEKTKETAEGRHFAKSNVCNRNEDGLQDLQLRELEDELSLAQLNVIKDLQKLIQQYFETVVKPEHRGEYRFSADDALRTAKGMWDVDYDKHKEKLTHADIKFLEETEKYMNGSGPEDKKTT